MIGVGQRIGNYRVLRKLGQGGMGAVYEAVQEQIGRRAAIKVLHPEYADDKASIRRFFDEARAVNIIQHPGLVGVFESGRLEEGGAYIVMEYLDGELLTSRLEKAGQLGHRDVLGFGRQIASALTAAHHKGIVHRDLKPDNIMIVSDPETVDGERVKVFDFGIAKLRLNSLNPSLAPKELRTQTGMIMGTPTHMAPEQCRGATDVTGKADVYSLGIILYQMLVGHPPFVADSPGELVSMHLRDKPPNLRKLDPSIPEELADLVHLMLSKEPDARPNMAEVVDALEGLGAYRTRRLNTAVKSTASRSSAGSSRDAMKPRPGGGTLQQAVGQTLSGGSGRRFALAIVIAGLLVMISGFVLFESELSLFLRRAPPIPTATEVTWVLNSDPEGAQVVNVDNGLVLGQTPWQRKEMRREGSLRVSLQAKGFGESIVVLKYSETTNQKVSLERLAPPPGPVEPPPSATTVFKMPEPMPGDKKVLWSVATRPKGAEIVRTEDGHSYGRTPQKLEFPQSNGILKLVLRLEGYHDSPLLLDLSTSNKQTILLQRDRSAARAKDKDAVNREAPPVEPAKQTPKDGPKEAPKETPKDPPKETPKETPRETPKEAPIKEALKPASEVSAPK